MEAELLRQARSLFGDQAIQRMPDPPEQPAAPDPPPFTSSTAANSESPNGSLDETRAPVPTPEISPPATTLRLTARQQSRLWRHVESIENFWESLSEIEPGAVARLATLAADRRWEIIFLTKRPRSAGATSQVQTQRWLQANGFPLPSVFVVQGSRGRIADSLDLDFVIDDRPENCLDVVVDSKARVVLVWREDERLLPPAVRRLGIGVAKSVGECLDVLIQIDSPPQERTGVVDRVKRLLGLKTETASA